MSSGPSNWSQFYSFNGSPHTSGSWRQIGHTIEILVYQDADEFFNLEEFLTEKRLEIDYSKINGRYIISNKTTVYEIDEHRDIPLFRTRLGQLRLWVTGRPRYHHVIRRITHHHHDNNCHSNPDLKLNPKFIRRLIRMSVAVKAIYREEGDWV